MANLMERSAARAPLAVLGASEADRTLERLRAARRLFAAGDGTGSLPRLGLEEDFLALLEDLDAGASVPALEAVLSGVDDLVRVACLGRTDSDATGLEPAGGFVAHWPGRSLETGEAERASQGYFDGLDRPPIGLWVGVASCAVGGRAGAFEVALLSWVPAAWLDRARRGCEACPNGSLRWLDGTRDALGQQLDDLARAACLDWTDGPG